MKAKLLIVSLFINTIALIICIIGTPEVQETQNNIYNIFYSILAFICICIFLRSTTKLFKNIIKYDFIFLVGFMIVHFQIPFLYSVGIRNFIIDFAVLNTNNMNFITWFGIISILFWMFGYQLFCVLKLSKNKTAISSYKRITFTLKRSSANLFLIIIFVFFLITGGKALLSGIYDGGQSWGANASYFYMLLRASLIFRLFYFFYNNKETSYLKVLKQISKDKVVLIVLIGYVLVFFIGGQRSSILELIILTLCAFSVYIRRIGFIPIFTGIILGSFVFTLLGTGRTSDSSELKGNILERGFEKFNDNQETKFITDELAGSNRILYIAVENFPSRIDFLYGKTMLIDIIGVLPFAGQLFLGDSQGIQNTSTLLFTYLDQGRFSTYGSGSEILADIYINFGVIGSFVIFFAFGILVAFLQFKFSVTKEFYWGLIASAILISALFINRAQLLSPLKDVFYVVILAKIFLKKVK